MKIVTVNIPESYLESINRLLDNKEHNNSGLYPSRSELIRVAVRAFLIRELKRAETITKLKFKPTIPIPEIDDKNVVRVPFESQNEAVEQIREFKTYKIVKRLDY